MMKLIYFFILLFFLKFNVHGVDKSSNKKSISISILMPPKTSTVLNLTDQYFRAFTVAFRNPSSEETTITKSIPRTKKYQEIRLTFFTGKDFSAENIFDYYYYHYFIIDEQYDFAKFNFDTQKQRLVPLTHSIADYSEMYNGYFHLMLKSDKWSNKQNMEKLDSLYLSTKEKSKESKFVNELNEIMYYNNLQIISPDDESVRQFLLNVDSSALLVEPLFNLFFIYTRNNIDKIDLKSLNDNNYRKEFISYFAIGAYCFLRRKENKGNKKYQHLIDWLIATDLYKEIPVTIRKEILPRNKKEIKENLSSLSFEDINQSSFNLKKIIDKIPADFYLLDLWATWCGPCLQGFKEIEKLHLPKNLKVIKISVDESEKESIWKEMSVELSLENNYIFLQEHSNNGAFLRLLEFKSIPRYILIDKDMMVIDDDFYQPHEPKFIEKLEDICSRN